MAIFLAVLLSLSILFSSLAPLAAADLGHHKPDPPEGSGPGTEMANVSSYLKHVDVYLSAYDERAYCNGSYILSNPSNQSEDLEIYFDPGDPPLEAALTIDGKTVNYTTRRIGRTVSNYWAKEVLSFPLNLSAGEEAEVNISWEMETKTEYDDEILWFVPYASIDVDWHFSYLIIATSAWERNIETVNVTFDIRSERFSNYRLEYQSHGSYDYFTYHDVSPSEIETNEDGFDTVHFRFQNFSRPSLYILLSGDMRTEQEFQPTSVGMVCCLFFIFMGAVLVKGSQKEKVKKWQRWQQYLQPSDPPERPPFPPGEHPPRPPDE